MPNNIATKLPVVQPSNLAQTVTQASHGFTVGAPTPVYYGTGGSWAKADSSNGNGLAIGIAVASDANTFTLYTSGAMSWSTTLTATTGNYYYVSDVTPGTLTATEPTSNLSYSNPILFATASNSGIVMPYRPSAVQGGIWPGSTGQLTSAAGTAVTVSPASALSGGVLTLGSVGVGTLSSRPAQGSGTKMYVVTDGPWPYIDDGSTWRPLIRGNLGYDPPLASTWDTSENYGSAITIADTAGSGIIGAGINASIGYSGAAAARLSCATQPIGATNTIEALFEDDDLTLSGYASPNSYTLRGIGLLKSSTDEWVFLGRGGTQYIAPGAPVSDVINSIAFYRGSSYTAYTGLLEGSPNTFLQTNAGAFWLQLKISGGNVIASVSHDGSRWLQYSTVAVSTVWSAGGTPNKAAIIIGSSYAGAKMHIMSWRTY